MHKGGFTSSHTCPVGLITGNTVTLSTSIPFCVKGYSCRQEYHFSVGFGQFFGQNWIHVVCEESDSSSSDSWTSYHPMLDRAPDHAQSMKKARSGAACYQIHISLDRPGSCRLPVSRGRALGCLELTFNYLRIPVSVMYQVNGQASTSM